MQQNLKKLLELLLENEIDFVLAGGLACVVHGSPLVTQDLDICLSIDSEQIQKLRNALKDINPVHRMNPNFQPSFTDYPVDLQGINNIYLKTDLGILDILSTLSPVGDFKRIKQNSISLSLYGYSCRVVALEDLIQIKETMTRPKDKEALLHLKEIRKQTKTQRQE